MIKILEYVFKFFVNQNNYYFFKLILILHNKLVNIDYKIFISKNILNIRLLSMDTY